MGTRARRLLLVVLGVAVIAVVAVGGLWYGRHSGTAASASSPTVTAGTSAPATSTASVSTIPRPPAPTDVPPPSPGQSVASDPTPVVTGGNVQVAVTYADWDSSSRSVEVDGFVTGVIEAGGTCLVTLTRGADSVTAQSTGMPNASSTVCGSVTVKDARLTSGTWQAVLSYRSSTATGASGPVAIKVPS
jgi:hypothetical protein